MRLFNRKFLLDASERITATFVMAGGASLIAVGFDDYRVALGVGGLAAVGSLVKAVAATGVGDPTDASLVE